MREMKVVLVTGASSGIGRAIAAHLAQAGYRVFGTSRQPTADTLDGFTLLKLDVTIQESVDACVADVLARAGRIDVLINNAGVDLMGTLEETPIEDAHWIFETNFFGTARMVKAVVPHMRERRSGQIINISSALGRAAWPFEGYYCASKYALEGYTETLCYEMNMFGIKVSSVQPGFYKSNINARQRVVSTSVQEYEGPHERSLALAHEWVENAPDPLPVAQTVQKIIESRKPHLRYAVGIEAHVAPPLAHLLPLDVRFKAGRWMLGIDDPKADLMRWSIKGAIGLLAAALLRRLVKKS